MQNNIITAAFGSSRKAKTRSVYQWDYGLILRFSGLSLPEHYEVHFANQPGGLSKTALGDENGVEIINEYLTTGKPVYAWVYVHTGDSDGETVYMVTIPVIPRARPTDQPATPQQQSAIAQAMNLLNRAIEGIEDAAVNAERAETAAEAAEDSASEAAQSATNAAISAQNAAASESAASVAATDATEARADAQAAAGSASDFADNAAASALAAAQSASAASASASTAADDATAAANSATAAAMSAQQANGSAMAANAAATSAASSASAAAQQVANASGYASQASASATAAADSATAAEQSATSAAGSASSASASATAAASSEASVATNAARAEAAAESAAAFIDAHVVKKAAGQIIAIDDAVVGSVPLSAPEGAVVYNRNAFLANIATRTSNGVTFTQDTDDPNTVTLNGTATGNAYSYAGITTANAAALLEPGRYYIASYADTAETYPILYADVIDYATGVKTAIGNVGVMNSVYALTLTAKSYLGVRVQLASGNTVNNLTVHVYISPAMPDYEYVPYTAPDGTFKAHSVMVLPVAGDVEYYGYYNPPATPYSLRIATFNVGEYDHGASTYPDTPADFDLYTQAIAEIGADILFTQEDRVYKAVSEQITTWDALYQYMYSYGGIVSNSISTNGMMAKGIYGNVPLYQPMRVTFAAQADNYWSSMTVYLASVSGKIVLLLSAHLAPREANASVRAAQIAEIMQYVSNIAPDYCIIAGDLNTWGTSELDAFTGFIKANCGPFGQITTYPTGSHFFDNILVTPNIKLQGVRAVPNDLGDHYALVADIVLEV